MTKKVYRWHEGELVEILGLSPEVEAAAVHQDTLASPLRHPVTGRIHDSKSEYLRDCERTGTRVVGNDWLNLSPSKPQDKITDSMIIDKIHKAEAIMRDPAKRRERNNLSLRMAETSQRFMKDGKITVGRIPDERRKYG